MGISSEIIGGRPVGLELITVSSFLGFITPRWGGCISFNPRMEIHGCGRMRWSGYGLILMSFPTFSFNLLNSGGMWEVDPKAGNTTYLKAVTQVGLTFSSNDFDDFPFSSRNHSCLALR